MLGISNWIFFLKHQGCVDPDKKPSDLGLHCLIIGLNGKNDLEITLECYPCILCIQCNLVKAILAGAKRELVDLWYLAHGLMGIIQF